MIAATAIALFTQSASRAGDAHVEVGTRGRAPHTDAYLKLTSATDPSSYAIVSISGSGWFELEVTGGYRTASADDLATDDDVREYVEDYLSLALAYLEGRWSSGTSRFFRLPFVTVQTENRSVKLVQTVRDDLRHIFKR